MDRTTLTFFKRDWKLSVVHERLKKLASVSEISSLSSFNTLHGLLYGTVVLLISGDERIKLISSLPVGKRGKNLGFSFVK